MGERASDRAHRRRIKLVTTRPGGCEGPPDPDAPVGRPNLGLHRRAVSVVLDPTRRRPAWGPGIRRRLVPRRPYRHGDFAVHLLPSGSEGSDPARRRPLSPAIQDREHGRTIEGLAAHLNQIRPIPDPVPLGMRAGSHGHLLVMGLEPNKMAKSVLHWTSIMFAAIALTTDQCTHAGRSKAKTAKQGRRPIAQGKRPQTGRACPMPQTACMGRPRYRSPELWKLGAIH